MTQNQQILNYLKTGKPINPLKALKHFGCFRLGARIYDLKKQGHKIDTSFKTKKNKTYAVYTYANQR